MSSQSDGAAPSWAFLANEARSGRLMIVDQQVASACAKACNDLIDGLVDVQNTLTSAKINLKLGQFQCGDDLAKALTDAIMGSSGFHGRIGDHIEIVKLIHDTVKAQIDKYDVSESDLAAKLKAEG